MYTQFIMFFFIYIINNNTYTQNNIILKNILNWRNRSRTYNGSFEDYSFTVKLFPINSTLNDKLFINNLKSYLDINFREKPVTDLCKLFEK